MEDIMNVNVNTTKGYDMMRPQRPATLTMKEDSRSISKPRPKIRIVHILAPEIIKTEPANFRELVQRLTGKPAKRPIIGGKKKKKARQVVARDHEAKSWRALVKGEEEDDTPSGGYLSGLGDVDGFLQGFCDFPMFPLSSSSHMDHLIGIGEAQVT